VKSKEEISRGLSEHVQKHGEWVYDIPLPHGFWTRGNEGLPHTRLKRILQVASDTSLKPLSECRVLDLGCLDGLFSIEFALQGAHVTGVEVREANYRKAEFARAALELETLQFVRDDVRNISLEAYGSYDIVICSGILYHLPTPDVFHVVETMYAMTNRVLIIDTHISLSPSATTSHKKKTYHGHFNTEHSLTDTPEEKERKPLASIDNNTSFWFTRPSLVNLLSHTGFTSVYECFDPPHLNFGRPGLEHLNRCTFLAIRGRQAELHTSPASNGLQEDWPEESLAYCDQRNGKANSKSSISKIKQMFSKII